MLSDQLNYAVEERQYEYTAVAIVKLDIPRGYHNYGWSIFDFIAQETGNFLLYCRSISNSKENRIHDDPAAGTRISAFFCY